MKKIFILMLILSCSILAKAQDGPWKLLYSNDTSKTYIDTERTQKLPYIDGHMHVIVIWTRMMSSLNKQGVYARQLDEKMAVDVTATQYILKSIMLKVNGILIVQQQVNTLDWTDIYPETNGEKMLFYCRDYVKSLGD